MIEEIVRISAHENLIIDSISRQAGSVEKAVLELVMNAIEAQLDNPKPMVDICFSVDEANNRATLKVHDLGRGFKNRLEVEEWFAKFGTPHSECPKCKKRMTLRLGNFICECGYKTGGRTWAEFRMGRGQAFSFGRNVWRTGKFRMEYDLKVPPSQRNYAHGDTCPKCKHQSMPVVNGEYVCKCGYRHRADHVLDFQLQSDLPEQKGCEVTVHFYKNPVGSYSYYASVDAFKSAIKHHVEFIEGEIFFNGEQINTPASECNWDVETEDAYFMFGKGSNLALYNIGAFVKDFSVSHVGVTGVVVSKEKMKVNFARNDVQQDCEIFQRIQVIIRENKIKRVRRARRRLDSSERISTLNDLRDGDCDYDEVKNIGLFELTDGKVLSLEAVRKIRSPWTFAKPGSRVADQLMQIDAAICFSEDTTDRMDYSGELGSFFDWLLKRQGLKELERWSKIRRFYRSFEILADGYSNAHRIIPTSKLSKAERRFLTVMERYDCWNGRTFCIGVSDTANGWTDGKTYIAFNRDYLKWNNPQYSSGAASLVTLAFHEMAHDEEDTGSHNHKVEFYQRYHDLTRNQALW
ncbi:MAG: hypothetical protein ACE5G1_13985, partial [bacterium]